MDFYKSFPPHYLAVIIVFFLLQKRLLHNHFLKEIMFLYDEQYPTLKIIPSTIVSF